MKFVIRGDTGYQRYKNLLQDFSKIDPTSYEPSILADIFAELLYDISREDSWSAVRVFLLNEEKNEYRKTNIFSSRISGRFLWFHELYILECINKEFDVKIEEVNGLVLFGNNIVQLCIKKIPDIKNMENMIKSKIIYSKME